MKMIIVVVMMNIVVVVVMMKVVVMVVVMKMKVTRFVAVSTISGQFHNLHHKAALPITIMVYLSSMVN